jgi:hypothetical protein
MAKKQPANQARERPNCGIASEKRSGIPQKALGSDESRRSLSQNHYDAQSTNFGVTDMLVLIYNLHDCRNGSTV